jgi:hypothetical protein
MTDQIWYETAQRPRNFDLLKKKNISYNIYIAQIGIIQEEWTWPIDFSAAEEITDNKIAIIKDIIIDSGIAISLGSIETMEMGRI